MSHSTWQESVPRTSAHALHRQRKARPAGARAELTCSCGVSQARAPKADSTVQGGAASRHARGGHLCTSLTLLPLPHLAWNWPLGQRLKNFIRCAGRQVEAPSGAGYLFNWGARHKRADFLCKRRSWPSCPRSARLRRTARELGGAVPAPCWMETLACVRSFRFGTALSLELPGTVAASLCHSCSGMCC